jgi:hypothetical protein
MTWGFTEFKTNKKNENMTFLMEILQGLMLKHVYILSILNFPLNMEATISYLSVVVNPYIPICRLQVADHKYKMSPVAMHTLKLIFSHSLSIWCVVLFGIFCFCL